MRVEWHLFSLDEQHALNQIGVRATIPAINEFLGLKHSAEDGFARCIQVYQIDGAARDLCQVINQDHFIPCNTADV